MMTQANATSASKPARVRLMPAAMVTVAAVLGLKAVAHGGKRRRNARRRG